MRWSLILSTFIAAQFALSFAAVIPSSDQLQRRARLSSARVSSKAYRKNSENAHYAYKFDLAGSVTREKLKPSERHPHNQEMLMIPKTDADHIFEHQILDGYLDDHGLAFDKLDADLQENLKRIINGPGNMAPVPAGVNRGKGQLVKHGMKGKAIAPKKVRDEYTKVSYRTARKTAQQLDQAFKDGGHTFGKATLQRKLRGVMDDAKLMKPNDPSPASSRPSSPGSNAGSTKGTPKRPARPFPAGKPSPAKVPARKSGRVAAKLALDSTKGTPKRPARAVGKPSPAKVPARKSSRVAAKLALGSTKETPKRPARAVGKLSPAKAPAKKTGRIAAKPLGSTKGTPKRPARAVGKPSPAKAPAKKSGRIAMNP